MASLAGAVFMDFAAVCHVLGLRPGRAARTWAWRNAKRGSFPIPVKLAGGSRIMWKTADIEAFIASRRPVSYAATKEAA